MEEDRTSRIGSAEWDVMVALVLDDLGAAKTLLEAPESAIDWPRLMASAAEHALLPQLANALGETMRVTPGRTRRTLRTVLAANRYRCDFHALEASRICEALRSTGVPIAVTKGTALYHVLYGADGTREFGDIDLMTDGSCRSEIETVLAGLGYEPGLPSRRGDTVAPLNREDELAYALSPDHIPRHVRQTEDLVVPVVAVDVAHSLTWKSSEWQVSIDEAMAGVEWIRVGSTELPVLGWAHHFLFVVLHLFRESWFVRTLRPHLSQLRDVVRLSRSMTPDDVDVTRRLIATASLEQPVSWALGNIDGTIGSQLIDLFSMSAPEEEWLRSAVAPGGRRVKWCGSLLERLRDGNWATEG